MDQARTLRQLLGQTLTTIHPILGSLGSPTVGKLARQIMLEHAQAGDDTLLFDASPQPARPQDLLQFFQGRAHLEDLVFCVGEHLHMVPAAQGLRALMQHPEQAPVLLQNLHRLPLTCDRMYATLSPKAWALASRFAPSGDWIWLVQPTRQSVTTTFQSIRQAAAVCKDAQHRIIVEGGRGADEADHVYASLLETTLGLLSKPLQYCGHIPTPDSQQALARVAKALCAAEAVALS